MSTNCIRPHCAIRSHKHNAVTYASFLGLSENYQQVALLNFSCERERKNIENHKILCQPFCKTKNTFVDIIRCMISDIETEQCMEMKRLRVIYIYNMLNTLQALKIRARHTKFELTVRRKIPELLSQTDDKHFIETLSSFN